MRFRCLLFISTLLLLPVISWADTHTAASASYAAVSAAVTAASAGDTVMVPAGTATWSSTLLISKQLTLIGNGAASTVLTRSGGSPLIDISLSSDVAVRVSGFGFNKVSNGGSMEHAITIDGENLTKIRIDHNTFTFGGRAIFVTGWTYGVIDNNTFTNWNIGIGIAGDETTAWGRPIEAGTANALFIEDNTFTLNNSVGTTNNAIYHQEGARTVIRNNTFDVRSHTSDNSMILIDSHGNQGYYPNGGPQRGQPIIEIYNNTLKTYNHYAVMYIRGGSLLIYNNTITYQTSQPAILFTEEEGWQSSFFSPLKTSWPAEDQINNTFVWGNTLNGSPIGPSLWQGSDSTFIHENRDYFTHAPASSGGKETYPTRAGASNMIFSSSGANAYYPYTPYEYPHPLRTQVEQKPTSPQNLSIIQQ